MEKLEIEKIRGRITYGILALISQTFLLNIVSFGASLIIFTVLSPRDVGIFIAVTAIQRIISFFTDFGFGAALVQKKDKLTREDLATAFTIQAAVTISIFIIIFLFVGQITTFFKLSESAERLFIVLVFTIFLSSFKMIPSILLERAIKFQKLVIPQTVEQVTFYVILVILILQGLRIDSYVWAFLISSLISIPFYYYISPWKISVGIYKKSIIHMKYGLQFQAKNILATIKDDLLTVFLVKILTFTEIGYIGFAQKFAFFVFRYIVDSVTKVTFTAYSRIQDNTVYLARAIEKSLFFVSSVLFPIIMMLVISAPYLVTYVPKWHNKWEPAIISLTFFSINAAISALSNILVNVLDATGRVKTTLRLMIMWTVLTWTITPLLIWVYGYNGVAIASVFVALTIIITIHLVKKVIQFDFIKSIYKALICTAVMGSVLYTGENLFARDFVSLIIVVIIAGLIYASIFYFIAWKDIKYDIKAIFLKKQP